MVDHHRIRSQRRQGGNLFADGPSTPLAIATLPLADGYTTTFRNFDMQTQQSRVVQLSVVGSEQATVPAGTFDTFKVEMTSAGGQKATAWVAKDTRVVVKSAVTSPQLNDATVTMELQK
jgi:hypothetical protein